MGAADVMRGYSGGLQNKGIEQIIYGGLVALLIAIQTGNYDFVTGLAIAATFAIGISFGWGRPIGEILDPSRPHRPNDWEWYQFGVFKKPWPALFLRGALVGIPCLAVYSWQPAVISITLAYTIAIPLAVGIASIMPKGYLYESRWITGPWTLQEALRG